MVHSGSKTKNFKKHIHLSEGSLKTRALHSISVLVWTKKTFWSLYAWHSAKLALFTPRYVVHLLHHEREVGTNKDRYELLLRLFSLNCFCALLFSHVIRLCYMSCPRHCRCSQHFSSHNLHKIGIESSGGRRQCRRIHSSVRLL